MSAEDARLFSNAKEMKAEAVAHRATHLQHLWDQRNRFFMGDHWYDSDLLDYQFPVVINFCRKIYRWYLSLLTDQPSRISVAGRSPDDYEKGPNGGLSRVERIDANMRYRWDTLSMDNRMALGYSYALPYGLSWFKVFMNGAKKRRVGDVVIEADTDVAVSDPWYVLPDPHAMWTCDPVDIMDTAEYLIFWSMRSARYIKAM